jgi:hypothetical protein
LLSLVTKQKLHQLLVLSGLEFILGVWLSQGEPRQVKRSFCQQIELWEGPPAFLLVTQDDPLFAAYQPERFRGGQVVVKPLTLL